MPVTARSSSDRAICASMPADRGRRSAGVKVKLALMRQGLIVVGLLLLVAGLAWPWIARLGLGHLPGDVRIERPGFGLYLPLGSSLVVSIVLTLALWLWRR